MKNANIYCYNLATIQKLLMKQWMGEWPENVRLASEITYKKRDYCIFNFSILVNFQAKLKKKN